VNLVDEKKLIRMVDWSTTEVKTNALSPLDDVFWFNL